MTSTKTSAEDLSPEDMEEAYLEYRRACYDIVHESALVSDVYEVFDQPRSTEEFAQAFQVASGKEHAAELLLRALAKRGGLEADDSGRFRRVDPPDLSIDESLLELATGHPSLSALRHSENYAGIIGALKTEDNPVAAGFDQNNIPLWEEVLQAPFYRYSRVQAVRDLTQDGAGKLLDLACGPGFGLEELGELSGPDASLIGVEISRDFVCAAVERHRDDDRIRVVAGDVTHPLDVLQENYFDGAMIVGAYHFLQHPQGLWDNAARLLKPGGRFCVAYALSQVGSPDQEIMNLRFELRDPPSFLPTRDDVMHQAESHGFELTRSFGLGAWQWYSFRLADTLDGQD